MPAVQSRINATPNDEGRVQASNMMYAHVRLEPNTVAGDWDEIRRHLIAHTDFTEAERGCISEWSQTPQGSQNVQTGPRPVIFHASAGFRPRGAKE